jgi:hypothetical protein
MDQGVLSTPTATSPIARTAASLEIFASGCPELYFDPENLA